MNCQFDGLQAPDQQRRYIITASCRVSFLVDVQVALLTALVKADEFSHEEVCSITRTTESDVDVLA